MFDISKQTVKLDCPDCKRSIPVSVKNIAEEKVIKCFCGKQIQLKDDGGTHKKAIRDINSSVKKLEDTFKKFGKRR